MLLRLKYDIKVQDFPQIAHISADKILNISEDLRDQRENIKVLF
jgi:hypothetical protein